MKQLPLEAEIKLIIYNKIDRISTVWLFRNDRVPDYWKHKFYANNNPIFAN